MFDGWNTILGFSGSGWDCREGEEKNQEKGFGVVSGLRVTNANGVTVAA